MNYYNFDDPFTDNFEEYTTWLNAGGDPSIVVGGETFEMQPTLTWNRRDFFGKQGGGFGSDLYDCEDPNTGLPCGMGVEYRQI